MQIYVDLSLSRYFPLIHKAGLPLNNSKIIIHADCGSTLGAEFRTFFTPDSIEEELRTKYLKQKVFISLIAIWDDRNLKQVKVY